MLQALTYLIDEGVIPKKVLCFIYLGNDLRDNYLSSNKSISYRISGINETHKKNRISQPNFIQRIKNITKKLELISWIYSLYKITKYASYFYGEAELYRRHPNKEFHSKALQSTEIILKLFKDIAEKYNIDLYFVLIPSKAQVYNEFKLISKYNKTENADEYLLDITKEGYDFNEIAKSFSNIITKYDMKFIDLTNPFKKEIKNGNKLFYIVDLHWNYTGQKIASDIINNQLISKW